MDIPEQEIILVENQEKSGPFGAKGVGEVGMDAVAPAIANAIYDAVGIRVNTLPITPEKIVTAMKKQRKQYSMD